MARRLQNLLLEQWKGALLPSRIVRAASSIDTGEGSMRKAYAIGIGVVLQSQLALAWPYHFVQKPVQPTTAKAAANTEATNKGMFGPFDDPQHAAAATAR